MFINHPVYLGYEISHNEISPLNSSTIAIEKFPAPSDKKSLQRFLGKINYYRRFIPSVTEILHPLFELLKNCAQFNWNEQCQKAFEKIKSILTSHPVLRIYNPEKYCFVQTDASEIGTGASFKTRSRK